MSVWAMNNETYNEQKKSTMNAEKMTALQKIYGVIFAYRMHNF